MAEGLDVVRIEAWARYGWLRHGFSTRVGGVSTVYSQAGRGDLNLGFTRDDDAAAVVENRARFAFWVAGGGEMVTVRQVHGTSIETVRAGETAWSTAKGRAVVEADGLVTDSAGVLLAIQVADCVPVLVADTRRRVVGAFHAGWRGTAAGIVERGIARMVEEFGCRVEDMVGAVGPSIGACCYAVGDELRGAFAQRFAYAAELFEVREGGMYLDLWQANRRQMIASGMSAESVAAVGECTGCARVEGQRKYFSHRAEAGFTGRAMGMIGVGNG